MPTYTWLQSFNRVELDTDSKYIEDDQYFDYSGDTYSKKTGEEIKKNDDTTGLTEIFIVGTVYYNQFEDDSTQEVVEDEITLSEYEAVATSTPTKA